MVRKKDLNVHNCNANIFFFFLNGHNIAKHDGSEDSLDGAAVAEAIHHGIIKLYEKK